ncbi:MAG: ATP-binding protein [Crocinitomicaceae bacterium]|jgi:serine/threonine-protein kinase RsbW|tara:strand:+ start:5831 stop:6244 length:414 start_codon:yes stop_codon:yes gene_type:complete
MKDEYSVIESLRLSSTYKSVADIERLIDKVCTSVGVNEDAYGNVLIAVTEAVNNAIQHGNKENEELSIDVSVKDNQNKVCFSVKDEGVGFDFENLPDPTSPENLLKENGRGIFLMRNLADKVEFTGQGNEVCLFFNK